MAQANFRAAPVADIAAHTVLRAQRRYGLAAPVPAVTAAWTALVASAYAQDLSVQDGTGVPHLPGGASQFEKDRFTPTAVLCTTFGAWGALLAAASGTPTARTLSPNGQSWRSGGACAEREVRTMPNRTRESLR